jgi:hypothetical protein
MSSTAFHVFTIRVSVSTARPHNTATRSNRKCIDHDGNLHGKRHELVLATRPPPTSRFEKIFRDCYLA